MKNASLVLALLFAAAPLAAIAAEPLNELPTNLPGIRTIAAPPEGFDALTATDADLAYYGFPPRPNDNSGDYASWAKAITASQELVVPILQQTNIYHGPARKAPSLNATVLGSYNWSGYVHTNSAKSYGKSSYDFVYSDVTVPTAKQADGKCTGSWDYGSSWVGIDGFDNDDVLQDGIEFDALCYKGVKSAFYSAWFEWAPFAEVRIKNMPIKPGEEYFMEIWSSSSTVGHAFLVNITKKKAVLVVFDAPKGTKLTGNSAEWITERPELEDGELATLTNYDSQKYSDAHGETFSGKAIDPGDSKPIVMVDNKGKLISYPTLDSPTSFTMKDIGSAK